MIFETALSILTVHLMKYRINQKIETFLHSTRRTRNPPSMPQWVEEQDHDMIEDQSSESLLLELSLVRLRYFQRPRFSSRFFLSKCATMRSSVDDEVIRAIPVMPGVGNRHLR
jgi:hypothetical protein